MRIVVTGGTGFIGEALVHELAERGDEVAVLSREARPKHPGDRVSTAAWTPGVRGPWTDVLQDAAVVINLAGAGLFDARWTPERLAEVRSSRIDATRVLSQAMVERCPRAALVSGSAVGLYGMRKDDFKLDETSPHHAAGEAPDVLTQMCEEWEASADPAREAGIRVAHPRIGIVLGRGGGALKKMLPAFKAFVGGPMGDGRQWMSWIHLVDVVSALMFLADEPECSGAYNLTAPEPVTMNELSKAIGEVMHRPTLFRVPSIALKLAMGGGRADALLTGQRVIPKRLQAAGFKFRYTRVKDALTDILR